MADEQKFADEMLTDEELDAVTGGTFEEFLIISESIHSNSILRKEFKGDYDVVGDVKSFLRDKLGIDANIVMDMRTKNKYTDIATGKSLSNDEVQGIILSYGNPNGYRKKSDVVLIKNK